MQIMFVPKDKLNCTMKKCTVSMATVNVILEDGGCTYKIDHISTTIEHGLILKLRHSPFFLW